MAEAAATPDRPLDEVMLAMDVVDTLRHRRNLVERELSEEDRDTRLIERLREIYRNQGIDVPDSVLAAGVAAQAWRTPWPRPICGTSTTRRSWTGLPS